MTAQLRGMAIIPLAVLSFGAGVLYKWSSQSASAGQAAVPIQLEGGPDGSTGKAVTQLEPNDWDRDVVTLEQAAVAAAAREPLLSPLPLRSPPPPLAKASRAEPNNGATLKVAALVQGIKVADPGTGFVRNPRAQLAEVVVPNHPEVKFRMWVHDPKDCKYMSAGILKDHSWEGSHAGRLIDAIAAVEGSSGLLDIGSNLGYFALAVAAAGHRVHALEPALYNTELIVASAAGAALGGRLTLLKTAVADAVGDPLCAMPNEAIGGDAAHNQGNFQLRPLADCERAGKKYKSTEIVPVATVDAIVASGLGIGLGPGACFAAIKIDVEGFETKALRGSLGVLTGKCPPCYVLLEYIAQPPLFELLVDEIGYACRGLGRKRANGKWKVKPMDAVKPYSKLTNQDYECKLVADPRCAAVPYTGLY